MSIRYLAIELYRLEREVAALQRELEGAAGDRRDDLELRLLRAVAERDEYRRRLAAKKEPPPPGRVY